METQSIEIKEFDIERIRKELPHGAIIVIAKKANVLPQTVSRALLGDKRSSKLPQIIKATAEYLAAYKKEVNEAKEAINAVLNPV